DNRGSFSKLAEPSDEELTWEADGLRADDAGRAKPENSLPSPIFEATIELAWCIDTADLESVRAESVPLLVRSGDPAVSRGPLTRSAASGDQLAGIGIDHPENPASERHPVSNGHATAAIRVVR
ncbi:MAG TPA: hypothetical protein VGG30_01070, partial [Pirellulales bacterium]